MLIQFAIVSEKIPEITRNHELFSWSIERVVIGMVKTVP